MWDLLRLLWKGGASSIRELTDQLYPEGSHSEYATVQSLLDRLERKDCVRREKQGRLNVFTATVNRGELVSRRLRETADALCEGSLAPLLSHLVRASDPTPEEADALQRLVERLTEENAPKTESS
ncbi:MAG: BlaI/MecI/CopY family transcriptional regulator [Acidobacteria bacterium]|nr:MAG: BlaI/MecI/CopY family transcriptional regulator [Acidobacteriota bacterium]RLE27529.1 MAG: BlaI/MecI/CopY family transcriptional regulator [Acidobacteriota bacterium]